MSYTVYLGAFVMCLTALVGDALASPWDLTLSPLDDVVVGEPVVLEYTITNTGREQDIVPSGPEVWTVLIADQGGNFTRVESDFLLVDFALGDRGPWYRLDPGESRALTKRVLVATNRPLGGRGDLQWLALPRAGDYMIKLQFRSGGHVYAEAIAPLRIEEPEDREREAWHLYRNKGVLLTVHFHGHRELTPPPGSPWVYAPVTEIAERGRRSIEAREDKARRAATPESRERIERLTRRFEREVQGLDPADTQRRIERILNQFPDTVYADILRPIHEDMQPKPDSGPFDQRAMWAELRQRLEAEGYDVDAFIADYPDEYRRKTSQLFAERREGKISRQEMYEQSAAAFEEILKKHQDPRR